MKKVMLLILYFALVSFAGTSCKDEYQLYIKQIPNQETVICRVSGEKKAMGLFFQKGTDNPAVLVYDDNKFLGFYEGENFYKKRIKCIDGVTNLTYMTSKQIVTQLLGLKKCEEGFSVRLGKSFTPNKGVFTDSRDGKKYKTVQIGRQIWMAENLNFKAKGSMCPDNSPSNCAKYGRLYDWNMAKRSCPAGWHLPSTDEIETLVNLLGGKETAREILKKANVCDDYDCGSDDFGFGVIAAGYYWASDEEFRQIDSRPFFWTATEDRTDFTAASHWDLSGFIENFYDSDKDDGMSVRCIQDKLSAKSNIHEDERNPDEQTRKIVTTSTRGVMSDPRDGQQYNTVTIGSQIWMAENMRYKMPNSYCRGTQSDCQKMGRYYTFSAATNACPSGWHLPSAKEFEILLGSVGGGSKASGKLKAKKGWEYGEKNRKVKCNGSDNYGFAALPLGFMFDEYQVFGKGNSAYFWSSSDESWNTTYVLDISCENVSLGIQGDDYGVPVRCLKD